MINTISINDVSLRTFGVFYDGSKLYDTPDKDVTFFSVPGKNGDLTISNDRFKNIEISINCFIRSDFQTNYSNLVNFLYSQEGYCKIETSTEPDIYRYGAFVKAIQPDTGAFLKYGQFTLVFNCKPQKYLKTGLVWSYVNAGASMTLTNPTPMTAQPLIMCQGIGYIAVGNRRIAVDANTSTTFIDCEIKDAYENATQEIINRNADILITGGFPILPSGETTIRAGLCTFGVMPRWWKL